VPASGNRVEWEFIGIMRVRDGKIVEHWTSMDLEALRRRCACTHEAQPHRQACSVPHGAGISMQSRLPELPRSGHLISRAHWFV